MSRLDPSRSSTAGHRLFAAFALALTLPVMTIMGCPFKADVFQFRCLDESDCDDGNECTVDACEASACSNTLADKGTPCAGKKSVCDGEGACVQCLSNKECTTNHITTPICDLAQQKCVSCTDGKKNGKETNVDCGGPDCGACLGLECHPTNGCGQLNGAPAFCVMPENICCDAPCDLPCEACSLPKTGVANGTCAPVPYSQDPDMECSNLGGCGATPGKCRCLDGVKNTDESDVDCGGTTCQPCGGGKMCSVDQDCAADVPFCTTAKTCCTGPCDGICFACSLSGQCLAQPVGFADPACPLNQACAPAGGATPCVGKAGAACSSNAKCLSQVCTGGFCAKSAFGKPCSDVNDCSTGSCQGFTCQ